MDPMQLESISALRPAHQLDARELAFLNHLRFVAMACRVKPRTTLFEACALLQVNREASQQAYADTLMRCLAEAIGSKPHTLAPGTAELTFDETWLIQFGRACASGDDASLAFLLRSRVTPEHRRLIRYLTTQVASHFL